MNTEKTDAQDEPEVIDDAIAQRWYNTGFKFAVNYLLAWIPKETEEHFDKATFIELVNAVIGDGVIDDKYFEKIHFYQGDNSYGRNCPDPTDPSVCIPCAGSMVQAVPKPTNSVATFEKG